MGGGGYSLISKWGRGAIVKILNQSSTAFRINALFDGQLGIRYPGYQTIYSEFGSQGRYQAVADWLRTFNRP